MQDWQSEHKRLLNIRQHICTLNEGRGSVALFLKNGTNLPHGGNKWSFISQNKHMRIVIRATAIWFHILATCYNTQTGCLYELFRLNRLMGLRHNKMIKVITGMRRCVTVYPLSSTTSAIGASPDFLNVSNFPRK